MNSQAGTLTKIEEILTSKKPGSRDSYRKIIELSMVRMQQLTHDMLRGYPHLQRWEQTDDVFQTAVIKLYRSLKEVKPKSARQFFGLAALQIRRTLIDLVRYHLGPQADAANHESDFGHFDAVDHQTDSVITLSQWTDLHEAVDKLPADDREVFSLIWYASATKREAAKLIGVSEKTIQRRFCRARILLAEVFDQDTLG
ncbi:MAG: RNA polymerase subunit sigma-70 [Blastopirellula sp.]|nr:MAG: RNA polymerase subunit sigma-70 [Blastopirellula sp.]